MDANREHRRAAETSQWQACSPAGTASTSPREVRRAPPTTVATTSPLHSTSPLHTTSPLHSSGADATQGTSTIIFTDGAWECEEVESPEWKPAGYGLAEFTICTMTEAAKRGARSFPIRQLTKEPVFADNGSPEHERVGFISWATAGAVETDRKAPAYIGAPEHTNNTGELSAIYYALQRIQSQRVTLGTVQIRTDSRYAMHMTTGKWMPGKKGARNAAMIADMRRMWRDIQRRRPGRASIKHVRSHVGIPGNELADWLAECGADGGRVGRGSAEWWLGAWMDAQSCTGDG